MITTCPKCGRNYEETSDETANDPGRLCMPCWHMSKVQEAERKVERMEKEREIDAKCARERFEKIEHLCRLVDAFGHKIVEGLRPSPEYGKVWHEIFLAMRDLGYCDYCGTMGCCGDCREDDR